MQLFLLLIATIVSLERINNVFDFLATITAIFLSSLLLLKLQELILILLIWMVGDIEIFVVLSEHLEPLNLL